MLFWCKTATGFLPDYVFENIRAVSVLASPYGSLNTPQKSSDDACSSGVLGKEGLLNLTQLRLMLGADESHLSRKLRQGASDVCMYHAVDRVCM